MFNVNSKADLERIIQEHEDKIGKLSEEIEDLKMQLI